MRRLILAAVLACGLALPAEASSTRVKLLETSFSPTQLTVSKGTKVKWVWKDESPHNVVVKTGPETFRSPLKESGRYVRKMTKRGTYQLLCTTHEPDMVMTLVVR
jgi:plastocyanin